MRLPVPFVSFLKRGPLGYAACSEGLKKGIILLQFIHKTSKLTAYASESNLAIESKKEYTSIHNDRKGLFSPPPVLIFFLMRLLLMLYQLLAVLYSHLYLEYMHHQ